MKILYYDCFAGISGDMNLGAMIDLGVDFNHLKKELGKIDIDGYTITAVKDHRNHIYGTKISVVLSENEKQPHRHLSDIEKLIDKSSLSEYVKETSRKIFKKIAGAEAVVHQKPVEKIHFHEVGAVDAIVDVVGAAICIESLKIDRIYSSDIEVGEGFAACAHGILPVPTPATTEILKDLPIKKGGVDFECTTPTGASILACIVEEFTNRPKMTIRKTGLGVGHKKGKIPNLLRVFLADMNQN